MCFIKVTTIEGFTQHVNVDHIAAVREDPSSTPELPTSLVTLSSGDSLIVKWMASELIEYLCYEIVR